ncbi:phage tail length tape measure family protein [Sphingomonas panni]
MDNAAPALEVGFDINTGASHLALDRLETAMGAAEASVVADAKRIEQATGNMVDVGRPTAAILAFGNATTRVARDAARDMAQVEKAGEGIVRQLERQNGAFGRTREELRGMKAEAAAVAAEQRGLTELAGRIREQESTLRGREVAAASKAAADRAAAVEAGAARERTALEAINAQLLERARLDLALERTTGVGRVRAVDAGATFSALEARERSAMAVEREVQAERDRTAAARQTNAVLAERAQIEAALERTTGVGRVRAVDAGATFSALAAKAAEDEARANAAAAQSAKRLADEHARLADMVRASHAAQEADAASAERMRAATDPLYAATKRLNAEIAESTRLYQNGATPPAEYARQQQVLTQRLREAERAHTDVGRAANNAGAGLRIVALQMPDVIQGLLTAQPPMQILIQQGSQIYQAGQAAGIGLRTMAASVGALILPFTPLIAVLGVATAGFGLFVREMNRGVSNSELTRGLGKTAEQAEVAERQLKKLKEETITWGDTASALFTVVGKDIKDGFVKDMADMGSDVKAVLDDLTSYGRTALAGLYAGTVGMKAYLGEISKPGAMAALVTGKDPTLFERTIGKQYDVANAYLGKLGARVQAEAKKNARIRIGTEYGLPDPAKRDRHAEALAREAEATERQIANLYKLADAYGVSGAAALIAEARVKAESAAIKKQADIDAMVSRQVRLAIAERVSTSAKSAAAMRDEARIQTEVNAQLAEGNVTAERAAQLVQQRIAELPLLAAIEAAQQLGLKTETERATKALNEQQQAQEAARAAAIGKRFFEQDRAADDRLADLREELRLIGATDQARATAMARVRAERKRRRCSTPEPSATTISPNRSLSRTRSFRCRCRREPPTMRWSIKGCCSMLSRPTRATRRAVWRTPLAKPAGRWVIWARSSRRISLTSSA